MKFLLYICPVYNAPIFGKFYAEILKVKKYRLCVS